MSAGYELSRRRAVLAGLAITGLTVTRPAWAKLAATPAQTPGPFYPTLIPLDSDTDLVQVAGRDSPANGIVTHVFGRVLTEDGRPMAGVRVELWQCDAAGRYHHPREPRGGADPNFQGYGQTMLGQEASFRFRTIKPVPYPGRTPHIHFAVSGPGMGHLTTQLYIKGEPGNESDFILARIRDQASRDSVIVPFEPAPDIEAAALSARFDIILGRSLLKI